MCGAYGFLGTSGFGKSVNLLTRFQLENNIKPSDGWNIRPSMKSMIVTRNSPNKVESIVNEKIKENLSVRFEIMPLSRAKELGAIGLFDDKYQSDVKVYFVGEYSKEFCGGPHVDFTGKLERFRIIKQENLGKGQKRIYSKVNSQIE